MRSEDNFAPIKNTEVDRNNTKECKPQYLGIVAFDVHYLDINTSR